MPTQRPQRPGRPLASRLTQLAVLLASLSLILSLGLAGPAQVAAMSPFNGKPGPTAAAGGEAEASGAEEETEEGEEEEIEAICEEAGAEGEEGECEEPEASPPAKCYLTGADAAVSVDLQHDRLRVAIRYASRAPVTVAIRPSLRGGRGQLSLAAEQARFGRKGVFHAVEDLTGPELEKVAAARTFTIAIAPINAPRYCGECLDQQLSVKREAAGRAIWVDSESTFRGPTRHARRSGAG